MVSKFRNSATKSLLKMQNHTLQQRNDSKITIIAHPIFLRQFIIIPLFVFLHMLSWCKNLVLNSHHNSSISYTFQFLHSEATTKCHFLPILEIRQPFQLFAKVRSPRINALTGKLLSDSLHQDTWCIWHFFETSIKPCWNRLSNMMMSVNVIISNKLF